MEYRPIDLDAAFDKRVAEYFAKNSRSYTEEEWEDKISELYKKYAETYIPALSASPNGYYAAMSAEDLQKAVRARLQADVPIDGFLSRALALEKNRSALLALLQGTDREASVALDGLGDGRGAEREIFARLDGAGEALTAKIAETAAENADGFAPYALQAYRRGKYRALARDILCGVSVPSDAVFSALLEGLTSGEEPIAVCADRLARYGDEEALPFLCEAGRRENVGYLDWREIAIAVQALGGELPERDFTSDKDYQALQRDERRREKERENRFRREE